MEETAYHECGHAWMAAYVGGSVRSLTIEPDRDEGPERFGDTQIVWRRDQMTAKAFHNKLVLVALAGPVAEMIYRVQPLHPGFVAEWAHDWHLAWEAAEPILPNQRQRLAFLEEAARQLHQLLSHEEHWTAISMLADNLLAHETLEADEIREVLKSWTK
jgi:ATP-dependent Zn protease